MPSLCENCQTRPAVVFLRIAGNGSTRSMNLCHHCATALKAGVGGAVGQGGSVEQLLEQWLGPTPRRRDNLLSQLRVVAGYELVPHLSVFAGLTGNVWIKWHGADLTTIASEASFLPTYEKQNAHNSLRIWPGFVAGVQL